MWGHGKLIGLSIKKYGVENHERWVIIKNIPISTKGFDDLYRYETLTIKRKKTKYPNGYNLTDGGEGSINPSPEIWKKRRLEGKDNKGSNEKIKEGLKKYYKTHYSGAKNYKWTIEQRKKLIGKKHKVSEKTKEKISKKNFGKKRSEEQKKNIKLGVKNGRHEYKRNCKICNIEFVGSNPNSKYCFICNDLRKKLKEQSKKEYHKNRICHNICKKCGCNFTSKSSRTKYCNNCK
jgi:hypothetical protein